MCCGRVVALAAWTPQSNQIAWLPTTLVSYSNAIRSITRVFFNGAAAEKNFNRLVRLAPVLLYRRLPSTSPAQTMRYADKLAAWREAITARQ